jgi:predicted RNA polymerase sigma factor
MGNPVVHWELMSKDPAKVSDYQWVHSTKADLYCRLGRIPEAVEAYGKALE